MRVDPPIGQGRTALAIQGDTRAKSRNLDEGVVRSCGVVVSSLGGRLQASGTGVRISPSSLPPETSLIIRKTPLFVKYLPTLRGLCST